MNMLRSRGEDQGEALSFTPWEISRLPLVLAGSGMDPAGDSTDPADGSTDLTEVSYTLSKELLTELVMVVGAHLRGM